MLPSTSIVAQPAPKSRYFFIKIIILCLNLGVFQLYLGLWAIAIINNITWQNDFTSFYTASIMVWEVHGDKLYDFSTQTAYQRAILGGKSFKDGLLPFINPPHIAMILAPLAHLSLNQSYYLWAVVQVFMLALLLRQIRRWYTTWIGIDRALAISSVLAFLPLFINLLQGTFGLTITVAMLGLFLSMRAQRIWSSGIWLIVSSIKPQLMLIPTIMLWGQRHWRSIIIGASGTLLLMLGAHFWFGWAIWGSYLQTLGTINTLYGSYGIEPSKMYNLKGALATLLGNPYGPLISLISTIGFGCALLGCVWIWRKPQNPHSPQFALRFALCILISGLFNPHLYAHDALMIIISGLILADYIYPDAQRRPLLLSLALVPLCILAGEWIIDNRLGVRIPTLIIIAMILWLIYEIRHLSTQSKLSVIQK